MSKTAWRWIGVYLAVGKAKENATVNPVFGFIIAAIVFVPTTVLIGLGLYLAVSF